MSCVLLIGYGENENVGYMMIFSMRKTNKPKCTLVIILTIVHLGLLSPLKSVILDFIY